MRVGSKYSMSYLKPRTWWMRVLNVFKRRQRVDIQTQYERYGVRCFDLHLYPNENGKMCFANDGIEYLTFSVYEILNYLNTKGDCSVIITFEDTIMDGHNLRMMDRFKEYCSMIERIYTNIRFFGGNSHLTGRCIYRFTNERVFVSPIIVDYLNYTPKWMPDEAAWLRFMHIHFPYLYAVYMNHINYLSVFNRSDHICFFADFVDIGLSL